MEKQSDTKDTQGDSLQQKSPEKRSHSSAPVLRNNEHVLTPSKDHALSDKKKPM